MTIRTLLGASALALAPFAAQAQDLPPCENCADTMTVVSWGGAYQNSQVKAYAEPYSALTGVTFIWDESANEFGRQAARPGRGRKHHLGSRRRGGP